MSLRFVFIQLSAWARGPIMPPLEPEAEACPDKLQSFCATRTCGIQGEAKRAMVSLWKGKIRRYDLEEMYSWVYQTSKSNSSSQRKRNERFTGDRGYLLPLPCCLLYWIASKWTVMTYHFIQSNIKTNEKICSEYVKPSCLSRILFLEPVCNWNS